ncbi:hypothetical protein ACJEQ8_24480, partial [Klebsiella pneumoniae]
LKRYPPPAKNTRLTSFVSYSSPCEQSFRAQPCFTLAVKKPTGDFPVSARVVSSEENLVEDDSEK